MLGTQKYAKKNNEKFCLGKMVALLMSMKTGGQVAATLQYLDLATLGVV